MLLILLQRYVMGASIPLYKSYFIKQQGEYSYIVAWLAFSFFINCTLLFYDFLQVPIQVNRQLAYSDGMRVVEPSKVLVTANQYDGMLFTELDK